MTFSIQDRLEIGDLVASYNHAIDHFQAEAWAATFSADGVLMVDGSIRASGHAALIAYVARRRPGGTPKLRHWVSNLLVVGDRDTATLSAYVMAFKIDHGLGPPYIMGEYHDDVAKIGGVWKFRRRHLTVVAGASATSVVDRA